MRLRLKGVEGVHKARSFSQFLLATFVMRLALIGWLQFAGPYSAWMAALGGVAVRGVAYGLGIWALRVPEVHSLTQAIRRKII